jgi:hypothetical protein
LVLDNRSLYQHRIIFGVGYGNGKKEKKRNNLLLAD